MKRKEVKKQNVIQFIMLLGVIVLLNYISSFLFARFDLTAEDRYTLKLQTVEMLENLDDIVYVKVYLDGEMPVGFKRLRNATKEMLDEFKVYADDNVEYEFVNPSESLDKKTRNEIYRQLYKKGLIPTNVEDKDEDGASTQQILFPGMIITYKSQELAIDLLKNNPGASADQNLNNSIQDLEYLFISSIKKLGTKLRQNIAFIEGHGELGELEVADITNALSEFYKVERVKIDEKLESLDGFSAIVVAKPDSIFSEKDKFIIDQFIMNGGKALWLLDFVNPNMDSLKFSNQTLGLINSCNIEDQLFKYGVRINTNLIQDIQCAQIPVNTGLVGASERWEPRPWYYFPIIIPREKHPIVRNLNMLKGEFMSVIDTVSEDKKMKKTVLLRSSQYTKVVNAPVRISLDLMKDQPDMKLFNKPEQPVAILLEGKFQSVFQNRLTTEIAQSKDIDFKAESKPTKMIVVSDGDIIRNYVVKSQGREVSMPLGADRFYKDIFYAGNKEFILNAMNYLCDDSELMSVRTKELSLRLLDRNKIKEERLTWQLINVVLPVLFIILFGIVVSFLRKKRYA